MKPSHVGHYPDDAMPAPPDAMLRQAMEQDKLTYGGGAEVTWLDWALLIGVLAIPVALVMLIKRTIRKLFKSK